MVALCDRFDIALVVPTIDTELALWASLREPLAAAGTVVAVRAHRRRWRWRPTRWPPTSCCGGTAYRPRNS
ncbi:MAG: hypothetical protein R2755_28015 [Acidimicrobiales bacterium]